MFLHNGADGLESKTRMFLSSSPGGSTEAKSAVSLDALPCIVLNFGASPYF